MGHAMRSRVVLEHLVAQDHDVEIMASGRAVDFLAQAVRRRQPDPRPAHDLRGEPRAAGKTLWSNVLDGRGRAAAEHRRVLRADRRASSPTSVISDFESWTYLYGKTHRLPMLSHRQHADHQPLHAAAPRSSRATRPSSSSPRRSSRASCRSATSTSSRRSSSRRGPQGPHAAVPADPAPRDPRREAAQRRAPARLHDRRRQRRRSPRRSPKTGLECRIYGMRRDLEERGGRGQPPLPAVQRGRLHRRPRLVRARSSPAAASR